MVEKRFIPKEALAHGWKMTMKYWRVLLLVSVVYTLTGAANALMQEFAGENRIARDEVAAVYADRLEADQFYKYLQETGYIDQSGSVQGKLQKVVVAADLALPKDLEGQRSVIYNFLNKYRYRLPFPVPVFILFIVIFLLLNMFMGVGFLKICIMASRDQEPSITELFTNSARFIPFLLGNICCGLAIMGGLILFIVPGIIFLLMFQMFGYLIADKDMGPIEALKRSRVITKGHRGQLAIFILLILLFNVAGFLCLFVGLFFTMWASSIALAYVYDRLEAEPEGTAAAA